MEYNISNLRLNIEFKKLKYFVKFKIFQTWDRTYIVIFKIKNFFSIFIYLFFLLIYFQKLRFESFFNIKISIFLINTKNFINFWLF